MRNQVGSWNQRQFTVIAPLSGPSISQSFVADFPIFPLISRESDCQPLLEGLDGSREVIANGAS